MLPLFSEHRMTASGLSTQDSALDTSCIGQAFSDLLIPARHHSRWQKELGALDDACFLPFSRRLTRPYCSSMIRRLRNRFRGRFPPNSLPFVRQSLDLHELRLRSCSSVIMPSLSLIP